MDWTVTHSRYVLTDRWLSVRADSCRTTAGQVVEPYYVFEDPDWVNIVALTDAQEVILVRQYRHGIGKTVLELPGGTIDPQDPSPLEAARRELLEETGYPSQHSHRWGGLSATPATHNNQTHGFLATGCSKVASPRLDESEELEVILKPAGELLQLVRGGELLPSLHVGGSSWRCWSGANCSALEPSREEWPSYTSPERARHTAPRRSAWGVCAVHAVTRGGESLLSRCAWSRRTREAPGRHREVGSEGSVERMGGARDTHPKGGVGPVGTGWHATAKSSHPQLAVLDQSGAEAQTV
jgi:ADP-ribose pyrophosphatase